MLSVVWHNRVNANSCYWDCKLDDYLITLFANGEFGKVCSATTLMWFSCQISIVFWISEESLMYLLGALLPLYLFLFYFLFFKKNSWKGDALGMAITCFLWCLSFFVKCTCPGHLLWDSCICCYFCRQLLLHALPLSGFLTSWTLIALLSHCKPLLYAP